MSQFSQNLNYAQSFFTRNLRYIRKNIIFSDHYQKNSVKNLVSIRKTTGIEPLYITIATVTMNLIVEVAIVVYKVLIFVGYRMFTKTLYSPIIFYSYLHSTCINK